jgi:hypothetical protein
VNAVMNYDFRRWYARKQNVVVENRDWTAGVSGWLGKLGETRKGDEMQANTAFAGTADAVTPATLQQCATPVEKYTDEQVRQFVIALEDPFDPSEIKWRVTNTTSDRRRGQVIAYADPRAYTDRLNALFTVRGWTREYTVQVIQNFERKERGNGDGIISGKIVVTCRVTIDGMGSHSGLGEEWADNENAGTSAEAQAFKRACSCFGLGRYLYDLDGNWVDLDERKQPLSKPRLPDWALPRRKPAATGNQNGHKHTNGSGHLKPQTLSAQALADLRTKVKSLCGQVGFGLARSVASSIASMENPDEIQDAEMLSAVSSKLEDTLRGVGRLRTATGVVGQAAFSQLCREMNLAGDCLDDIPDRRTLRLLIEALERKAGATALQQNGNGHGEQAASRTSLGHGNELGVARANLVREAQRVGKLRNMKVSDVIDRAAKGAFRFGELRRITADSLPAVTAATDVLRQVTQ